MPHGNITRLVPEHGFGFLVDDAGLDWFFVRDGIRYRDFSAIWVDERVWFAYEWTPNGPRATDIHFEMEVD
jgi:cold shock CspA family protein